MKSGALALPLALLLPALFWLCHAQGWPLWLGGLALLPLALLQGRRHAWSMALLAAVLGAWALLARNDFPVRLYPVAINLAMLGAFGLSLLRGPSMIERFARLQDPALPPAAVAYCRKVTVAWCLFFLLNGGIALWTAVATSERAWAIYNGGIAYALIGLMFGVEWLIRRRVQQRIAGDAGV